MVSGRLREIGPGYIVLGRDFRIEVPADLAVVDCPIGSWCTVTLTEDRAPTVAHIIAHNEGAAGV